MKKVKLTGSDLDTFCLIAMTINSPLISIEDKKIVYQKLINTLSSKTAINIANKIIAQDMSDKMVSYLFNWIKNLK